MKGIDPQQFINTLPYGVALQIRFEKEDNEKLYLSMPYDKALVGDPSTGVIHGGPVAALLDTASGMAAGRHPEGNGGTATLDLRIDYMRAAQPEKRIYAVAYCYNMTRSVAFTRASAYEEDEAKPFATATGAFTNEPPRRRATP